MLGCTFEEFRRHIESQFQQGMTWENRSEWHIDHRIPISTASTLDELRYLSHYMNLQPLWAADNLRKNAKMPKKVQLHLHLR